jgi:hypothetical protein
MLRILNESSGHKLPLATSSAIVTGIQSPAYRPKSKISQTVKFLRGVVRNATSRKYLLRWRFDVDRVE